MRTGATAAAFTPSIGQSSGSSFGESPLSGEYYMQTVSAANEMEGFGNLNDDGFKALGGGGGGKLRVKGLVTAPGGSSSPRSWARQTEESYQLQLALAVRLSSDATCADDPNFLDPFQHDLMLPSSSASSSAEAMSHRFWVNGCLSYFDKVPDGFYLIHGMDPYVWTVCTDLQENGRIPSIESLRSVKPGDHLSTEVVLVDRRGDPSLKELQNRVHSISSSCINNQEIVDQLAKLVCNRMGGATSTGEVDFVPMWRECVDDLKDCLGSIVLPIGNLSVGLCRHRVLLFKVLADTIDLPCRIAKGCRYCARDDASSCLVKFEADREYHVDLIGTPGFLSGPDSLLNGPSSISISSPLRFPRSKRVEPTIDFRSLAKLYFSDSQSLNLVFDDTSTVDITGTSIVVVEDGAVDSRKFVDNKDVPISSNFDEISQLHLPPKAVWLNAQNRHSHLYNPSPNIISSTKVRYQNLQKHVAHGCKDVHLPLPLPNPRVDAINELSFMKGIHMFRSDNSSQEFPLDVEDISIPWTDLDIREKIGAGSFGTVHRADWHGSDVAVKILMEQDFHAERFKEFIREVSIMKRLRHPNIVLFMGAVTQPPNLSIVTEYLARGSLYRLVHKPGARELLDFKRRISMAYDVAKGMNYLHNCNPPIVHRDLKSPNLLVDQKCTVKVCDFGLSRLKANTFLSSKTAAGTPEWMAPEVLRDEPSNEKSDVYSFGVILWELATLQQPWSNLNPAQVVAAVGFKGKRLEIPHDIDPRVASIIEACWANEPWKRPSFSSIVGSLKSLIKAPTPTQPDRLDFAPV